jgi:sugar fermentation stimulation protein A
MQFTRPLIEGRLVRRYKRFLADVELGDGQAVVAHCPNPGSMQTCAVPGGPVWVSHHNNPARKLAYTWELAEVDGAMVCVNTALANDIVYEALSQSAIAELCGYEAIRREVRYGLQSRIDFLLSRAGEQCYVEVKSVTLHGGREVAAFPDSVTARGTKHLEELMTMVAQGHRAVLLFCCNRSDARSVRPADEIDPLYGHTLRRAAAAGVQILAYRSDITPSGIALSEAVPVNLPPFAYEPPRPRARQATVKRGAKKTVRLTPPS